MADPTTYRPAPGTIPTEPGVYKFRDENRRVIYVGKAKNLRSRLSNYFQDVTQLHPRTRQMVFAASSVEWTVVSSEVEALQLEYTWIKRFDPRFNVKYRDDKTYPMLAVSTGERFPRAFFFRGPRRKGVRYFGPYSHAWAVRETLDLLTRVFPMRTCSKGVFNRHESLGRPCLLGYIDKCAAPCVGRVSEEEHREIVDGFTSFMSGHTDKVTRKLNADMMAAAEELDFERAARLRDDLEAIDKVMEKQAVVLGDGTDADIIAFATDQLEAAVQVFNIRGGRIRGQRGWVVEKPGDYAGLLVDATTQPEGDAPETDPALPFLMQDFLVQFYGDAVERAETEAKEDAAVIERRGVDKHSFEEAAPVTRASVVPREILVQVAPNEAEQTLKVLEELRGAGVDARVPQRGDKRALMETVERNAKELLKQHKLKRVGDLTARSAALQELQEALDMEQAPLRIECTDISHIQGTDVVASLVVFEDGLPRKSDYRRYRVKEAAGDGHSNDVASIAEITRRRFLRHNQDKLAVPESEEFDGSTFSDEKVEEMSTDARRFAYPPQIFIVDGGAPQVAAAQEVFDELGIVDVVLIGLAKRLEEIWLPGDPDPVILPRNSQALFLLQQIRDEAHRFAITYHRQQRSKRMRVSELDSIKGLGQSRRTELVKHFGSVAKLKEASVEDISQVKGFGPKLAEAVYEGLHASK
ncbi:excinuclease ABC subunit C [Corynebacterium glutamicum Z188]|uniref:UvrABC system protein C n=1 Tax=Corynebacterium glutamicum TaxID=1718 RepID=A0AB36IFV6_CORGT|nr:excinuclease ABC subunit UvrC [Corynebacterium glutamicum]AGN19318.1 excinuclease ABC subunit C [Corynebacterium glutamicum SCgG1]AGN22343.1 excinuclease ABC subunit C [Corynebacterium glutamicum SCgG2]EGV40635.1 excinuclease ABC subunit C [Corynebacterium glutamicum S9114]EPP40529.1 excinuclease ABC subunit C [Corynebacterium glutamicum Z188]NII87187.1 excinuclease ABC subunit C [Corynebacterium glutamicum]